MKQCADCKETKDNKEFTKHKGNKDGLHSYCRPCKRAREAKRMSKVRAASCKYCSRPVAVLSTGLCTTHKRRYKEGLDMEAPIRPHGTGYVTAQGYKRMSKPEHPNASANGTIFEHIVVMTEHLGRPLYPGENVHHINGDKLDNRIENLELWSTQQPKGQRVEDKIEWAIELLKTYCPDILSI